MRTSNTTPAAPAAPATYARRLDDPSDLLSGELVPASRLAPGDAVLCVADDVVPAPGRVLDGAALLAPARHAASAVEVRPGQPIDAGARLVRGWIVIRLAALPS